VNTSPSDAGGSQQEFDLPELTTDAKNWAVICHLVALLGVPLPLVGHVVGPVVVWTMKRDDHPFIDDQGNESVNFQISMVIYMIAAIIGICLVVGLFLLPVLWVTNVIMVIVAAIKASNGEAYRYPFCLRLIK
jgi:uncharacterized protein